MTRPGSSSSPLSTALRVGWRLFVETRKRLGCTVCGRPLDGPTHVTGSSLFAQHHARCCSSEVATAGCALVEGMRAQLPAAPAASPPPSPRPRRSRR